METWLDKALELFPEFEAEIDQNLSYSLGPTGLWNDLYMKLEDAYQEQPINEDLIGRIYDYAAWCLQQPQTGDVETDLSSAVAVGLIEDLPRDERVAGDLYRWVSVETFEGCKELFRYHLSEEEYEKLHREFMSKKKDYSGPSRL